MMKSRVGVVLAASGAGKPHTSLNAAAEDVKETLQSAETRSPPSPCPSLPSYVDSSFDREMAAIAEGNFFTKKNNVKLEHFTRCRADLWIR